LAVDLGKVDTATILAAEYAIPGAFKVSMKVAPKVT
jgi:hypothetical protein